MQIFLQIGEKLTPKQWKAEIQSLHSEYASGRYAEYQRKYGAAAKEAPLLKNRRNRMQYGIMARFAEKLSALGTQILF